MPSATTPCLSSPGRWWLSTPGMTAPTRAPRRVLAAVSDSGASWIARPGLTPMQASWRPAILVLEVCGQLHVRTPATRRKQWGSPSQLPRRAPGGSARWGARPCGFTGTTTSRLHIPAGAAEERRAAHVVFAARPAGDTDLFLTVSARRNSPATAGRKTGRGALGSQSFPAGWWSSQAITVWYHTRAFLRLEDPVVLVGEVQEPWQGTVAQEVGPAG